MTWPTITSVTDWRPPARTRPSKCGTSTPPRISGRAPLHGKATSDQSGKSRGPTPSLDKSLPLALLTEQPPFGKKFRVQTKLKVVPFFVQCALCKHINAGLKADFMKDDEESC